MLDRVGDQFRHKEPGDFDALVGEAPALEDVDRVATGPADGVGGGGEGQLTDGRWDLVHVGGSLSGVAGRVRRCGVGGGPRGRDG
ncbi:hypothetical protein JCM13580A_36240 [Streptomyces drozdowiczii]